MWSPYAGRNEGFRIEKLSGDSDRGRELRLKPKFKRKTSRCHIYFMVEGYILYLLESAGCAHLFVFLAMT